MLTEAYMRNPSGLLFKNGLFFVNMRFLDEREIADALIESD